MTAREIIRAIMERTGVGVTELGSRTGNSPQTIWSRLGTRKAKDPSMSNMYEMCKAMGYKIVVVPEWCWVNPDGFVYQPDE